MHHKSMTWSLTIACFFAFLTGSFGQSKQIWAEFDESKIQPTGIINHNPKAYKIFKPNIQAIRNLLENAPAAYSTEADENAVLLELPMPDGTLKHFKVYEDAVMHPDLQKQFPEIRTYSGKGVEDPGDLLKCDITPFGFHAMVLSNAHSTVFIDPYTKSDTDYYWVYYKKDYQKTIHSVFHCANEQDAEMMEVNDGERLFAPEFVGDCKLRTYRLALACTGEYAAFHGGTVAGALAAMNTTMNRVNGIYQKEFSVKMNIIANNNLLVFLNANTDPYTNDDGGSMLGENQTTCNSVIGSANYDIGHVFSTGGGGVAGLGVVCGGSKANGVTGSGSPIGDSFDIDYVAHEMGHQFGGSHTFYNSCGGNKSQNNAVEPGSGSTIMAYAGICAPNVQNNSDDYFSGRSIAQMYTFITTGSGNNCPVLTDLGNLAPVANAGADYIIPKSTPFYLTATGTDPNSDALFYNWEQMDNTGSATQPPVGTNTVGPMFRSLPSVSSPERYFPKLADVVSNTTTTWEVLPSVERTMNFRVTVRDNRTTGGCVDYNDMLLTVNGTAGPFVVTAPNTAVNWPANSSQTVTWNVAGTTAAPISTANVKILLSVDGGFTYPHTLTASTTNSGTATITVPNTPSTQCRVRVEAVGNVYYDISNVNFTISASQSPTFSTNVPQTPITVCAGSSASIAIQVSSILGFTNPVQFTVTGGPSGSSMQFSPNPVTPSGNTTLNMSGFSAGMAGSYTLSVAATSGSTSQTTTVPLTVLPGAPSGAVSGLAPANFGTGVATSPTLTWNAVQYASSYSVEIANNPSFAGGTIVNTGTTSTNSYPVTSTLTPNTVYYWKLTSINQCGQVTSSMFAFQTGSCTTISSTNVPVTIPTTVATVSSTLNVPSASTISDANVDLNITHSWMGDLLVRLTSPTGTQIILFDRPGVPATADGCAEENIIATFDDQATNNATALESTCNASIPTISGVYQPVNSLSGLNGQSTSGTWTLQVNDAANQDGGTINSWSISFCGVSNSAPVVLIKNLTLTVALGTSKVISNANLEAQVSGTTNQVVFTLLSLPTRGVLKLNNINLAIGSTFTQADINNNLLTYTHTAGNTSPDSFQFSVEDDNNNFWLTNATFNINITQNSLAATATATQQVSCFNGNNGIITASQTGGNAPFTYSLNGGTAQQSPVFSGLTPGNYTVVVTDGTGFTSTSGTITLVNPSQISGSATANSNVITVTASGGTGTLNYSLNGGAYQQSNIFQGVANGTYTITIRDANNCTITTQATVNVAPLAASATVTTPIVCFGGTGTLTVSASGGISPYEYRINGGSYQSSNVFTAVSAGAYTINVRDGASTVTTINGTMATPPDITASASASGNTVTVTASGGTGALMYSINGTNFQSGNVFTGVANGSYTITVRDANNCTKTATVVVNIAALAATATVSQAILCFGGTGTLTVSASGGISPYEYRINGGSYQSSNVFTAVSAGAYTINVRDGAGTVTTVSGTMTAPPTITASASASGNTVTVTASGGTGALMYSINGTNFQSGNVFTGVANGSYTITVRDANNCTKTATVVVNIAALAASATVSQAILCFGGTGTLTVSASGGISPYEYRINGGSYQSSNVFTAVSAGAYTINVRDGAGTVTTVSGTMTAPPTITASASASGNTVTVTASGGTGALMYSINGTNFQSGNVFTGVANGSYTITVRDANNCTKTATVVVNIAALAATATVSQAILCFGGTGTLTVSASGGISPYEYRINGGSYQSSNVFTAVSAGAYTINVRDGAGTVTTVSGTMTAPPTITASASASGNTVTVTASGGTGALMYSINGTNFQSGNVFTGVANGSYTITVRDANNCTKTATVVVNIAALAATATVSQAILCFGGTGTLTVSASGGISPYEYRINGGSYQSSNVFTAVSAGAYTINVRDGASTVTTINGTMATPPDITASASASGNTVTVTATGGTGALMYSINGTNFQSGNVFTGVANGSYTITVRDANNCTKTATVVVNIAALAASATVSQAILCFGGTGTLTVSASGGISPYEYRINGGSYQSSNVFTAVSAGAYTINVRDGASTVTTVSGTMTAPPTITASASASGNTVTVTASGGTGALMYSINGTNFQSGNVFTGVANGSYTITVRDANNCTKTATVVVNIAALAATATVSQAILCFEGTGTLTVSASGGISPYEYRINGGSYQSSNVFTAVSAGAYTINVRDGAGTVTTINGTMATPPDITASASASGNTVTVTATGGTGALMYSINGTNFQSGNVFTGVANGSYTITIRDANNCTKTATVVVNIAALAASATVSQAILCFGGTGTLTVSASGGISPYEYRINGGSYQSSNVFTAVSAGAYTINVRDGASTVTTINGTMATPPDITASASASGNTVTVTATGGTGALTYSINGTTFQASNVFTGVANGTYIVTVKDANNCIKTTTITVNISALSGTVQITQQVLCNGGIGSINVQAAGGVAPLQYALDNAQPQLSPTFTNISSGQHTIIITDDTGATLSVPFNLFNPTSITALASSIGSTITVNATGGTGTLTYQLDGGSAQTSNVFQNVPPGPHSITITDANGCTKLVKISVTAPLTSIVAVTPVICFGSSTGVLTVTTSGGISPYTYSIDTGASYQISNVFSGLPAGSYNVIVKDAAGSLFSNNGNIITSPEALSTTVNVLGQTVTVIATGGASSYQYSIDGGNYQTSNVFSNLAPGQYTITVKDANGCTVSTNIITITSSVVDPFTIWGMTIAPNPSNGLVTLIFGSGISHDLSLKVYDQAGRLLHQQHVSAFGAAANIPLILTHLPTATYRLQILDKENVGAVQLLIIK